MLRFDTYHKLIVEGVTYKLPSSPQYWMADFYMLSFISTINFDALLKPSIQRPQGIVSAIRGEKYKEDIQYAKETLFPALKTQMLNDTFYAIVTELRHAFEPLALLKPWQLAGKDVPKTAERGKEMEQIQNRLENIPPWFYQMAKDYRATYKGKDLFEKSESYYRAYKFVVGWLTKNNISFARLVTAAENVFSIWTIWDEEYGGSAWSNICTAWLQLNASGNDLNKQAVYIDHIYDLEHNNGTVFNKIQRYAGPSEYDPFKWIKEFLDYKAQVKNPYELLFRTSSSMQKLAAPVLMAAGYSRQGLNPDEIHQVIQHPDGTTEEKWTNRQGKLNRGNNLPAFISRKTKDTKPFVPGESAGTAAWYVNGNKADSKQGYHAVEVIDDFNPVDGLTAVGSTYKVEEYGRPGQYKSGDLFTRIYKKVGTSWKLERENVMGPNGGIMSRQDYESGGYEDIKI